MRTECPHCGADLPRRARVCPECGSDEQTGWSEAAQTSDLGLPDDSFNYEEFVQREFGGKPEGRRKLHWAWWLVAAALAGLFLLGWASH